MKDGKLVPLRSPLASTDAIKEMIDNPMRAAKLGETAGEKVKKEFFIEKTAKGYDDFTRDWFREK